MPKGKNTVERKIYFDREGWEKVCRRAELSGKKVSKFIKEMGIYGEVKIYDISSFLVTIQNHPHITPPKICMNAQKNFLLFSKPQNYST